MAARESERAFSHAVQDYAKAIYVLEERGDAAVTTNALAERLGVTAGSASAMVKRLDELGLVHHVPYRGVGLTDDGRRVALEVLRHHRLLERFLSEELDVPWDRVHAEAEVLEHVLSEELEERIAAKLGHPSYDPHGDPIPTREGEVEAAETRALVDLEPGERGVLVRVSDSNPAMLRYMAEKGIAPGMELEMTGREPFGGPLAVRSGKRELRLGRELAAVMRMRMEG
ncbi:MAG: metal-dependent transcriptional regulator [Thermoleophilaceae bacterium]|jgi:DtxR family Mn-dependent transcriptional regulator|nr:metal-dependent transcriptional regulator [Thermoleophilaceae bacterium]